MHDTAVVGAGLVNPLKVRPGQDTAGVPTAVLSTLNVPDVALVLEFTVASKPHALKV